MLDLSHVERTFSFKVDGKEYTIPAVTSAPASLMTKMIGLADAEQGNVAISYVSSILPDGLLERLDTASLVELVTAWTRDKGAEPSTEGATLGES